MPIFVLCSSCRETDVTEVKPLEPNPRSPLNAETRHRLKQGIAWIKAWINCSVCGLQMECTTICNDCTDEANQLIMQAYRIVNKKELVVGFGKI